MAKNRCHHQMAVTGAARGGIKGIPLVVGCGSNVVDLFFPLRAFPQAGDKAYFANEQFCSSKFVGGVTLNHLCWARALGCPTALMALQGNDENGREIRQKLKELGVSTKHIRTSDDYSTSVSHILNTPDGERTIIMAPASTSQLDSDKMGHEFKDVLRGARMVTTEISQVPLSGVRYLVEAARSQGIPSLLDVDVPPQVALTSARLGSKEDLIRCVTQASVLKLTRSAAGELLSLLSPTPLDSTLEGATKQIAEATQSQLCVITDGGQGCALALGRGSRVEPIRVQPCANITQIDATGAGDAFFGGVVAYMYANASAPTSQRELEYMGRVASAAGAACVEVQGALPVPGVSGRRILELCPQAASLLQAAEALEGSEQAEASEGPTVPGAYASFVSSLRADAAAASALATAGAHCRRGVEEAVHLLLSGRRDTGTAHVYTSGVGKSGLVASRMAASLRSIGIRASYVPGAEWAHGDLGSVRGGDVLVGFSHSGGTVEMVGAAHWFKARGAHVVAVTGRAAGESALGRAAGAHLLAAAPQELLGVVPTRSIVAQEALVNGLLTAVAQEMGLSVGAFRENHPGGSIGAAADKP